MKIVERIIRGLFLFLFGLATGGIGMWFATMNVLKKPQPEETKNRKITYYDACTGRKISR